MASKCEDGAATGDFLDELPNFLSFFFKFSLSLKNIQEDFPRSPKVMLKFLLKGKKMQTLKKDLLRLI